MYGSHLLHLRSRGLGRRRIFRERFCPSICGMCRCANPLRVILGEIREIRDAGRHSLEKRFDNYVKELQTLSDAVELAQKRSLSMLEEQGVIQSFEFTHELGWNVLKDYLEYQGIRDIVGSRGAVREAFKNGLIEDGETWMTMIRDRNISPHTYDQGTAQEIVKRILGEHHPAFLKMSKKFSTLYEQSGNE